MSDLSEDERVALQALADSIDDPNCDSPGCESSAEVTIVVHGIKGIRHGVALRCMTCFTKFHIHNTTTMRYIGALRCDLCGLFFKTLDEWWKVERLHDE